MISDEYIKQYLLESGYSTEEIEADSFNIDSLRDEFSKPMELSRITNMDELKVFLAVHIDFIVTIPNGDNVKQVLREKIEEIDEKIGHADYKTEEYENLPHDDERKIYSLLQSMMRVQKLTSLSYAEVAKLAERVLTYNGVRKEDVGINRMFIRRDAERDKEERCVLWVKEQVEQEKEVYRYFTFNSEQQQFKSLNSVTIGLQ